MQTQVEQTELDRSEWILLRESKKEIEALHRDANKALQTLTELQPLGIQSLERFYDIKKDIAGFIRIEMLKDKKIRDLAQAIDIKLLTVPDHLKRAEVLINQEIDTTYLEFESEWQINFDKLEDYADSYYRTFAKEPDAIEKYNLAKMVCDYLNGLQMGVYSKSGFVSAMIDYHPEHGFIPDSDFVLSGINPYKN
jgi:hypothetical protein